MKRVATGLGSLVVAAGVATTLALNAGAAPPDGARFQPRTAVVDDLPSAAEDKRRALREEAIKKVIAGDAKVRTRGASKVVKLGKTPAVKGQPAEDQYVELAREKTDKIFVVLAEFGNERHPNYPDKDTDPNTAGPSTWNGPVHNSIPEPDRTKDNKTIWEPNFDRAHFQKLYFGDGPDDNSVKNYYERQSSGRYSVEGTVTDWVKVPYNEARYGRSNGYPCASTICSNSWNLIADALNTWVADQKAGGKTDAQIADDLKSYDVWDRNDYDADGNFNEPDGYIDHFQIVHAGGDQADADPYQGEDAIWSHRWKAFQNTGQGPEGHKDGGVQIGNTGLWVADYTMQPENGGVSVFAHEFAHDLGLPDEYDTTAATGTQENAVNWWSLMAQSRVSGAGEPAGGPRAADLGAWDKLQLGWLDYEVVPAGTARTLDLGPSEYNSAKAQGVVMPLPKKNVKYPLGAPHGGTKQWYSQQGNAREASLTRQVTLPAGSPASLSFWARWNIEDCGPDACDYAFVEVDDGSGFKAIPGSITNAAEGNGIDGYQPNWTQATFDMSAFAGKTVSLRLRYASDTGVQGAEDHTTEPAGIFADDFTLTAGGQTVFSDGAENGNNGWTPDGFVAVTDARSVDYDNYYVASNREYVSYDQYLRTGPYNYADPTRPNWAEHFPYQNGLIVSYWNTQYGDNDESVHPGEGQILPIDSHPQPIYRLDGTPWRGRIQTYDAPFSLEKADSFTLHMPNGQPSYIRGQAAVPVFDDRRSYWDPVLPNIGVKVPDAGVRIQVQKQDGTSMRLRISSTKPAN